LKPTAVGMHIYSGAWTLGFRERFNIVAQLEELDAGAKTFGRNLGNEIRHVVAPHEEWPLEELGEVNLVYANPPCAPWSTAGALLGMNDPRIQFAKNVSGAAAKLEPDFFIVESVCRAWSPTGGRPLYEKMALDWGKLGYAVTIVFTNTVLHGAPQYRERFHFVAHRLAVNFNVDEPTDESIMTVWDAIGDIAETAVPTGQPTALPNHNYEPYRQKGQNVADRLEQGEGWERGVERCITDGVEYSKARFISGRFRYNSTAPTLLDISQIVHPTKNRQLTMREGARLCGYPDWYEFEPSGRLSGYGAHSAELTQAALPAVGRYFGRVFDRALDVAGDVEPCLSPDDIRIIDLRPLAKPFKPRIFRKGPDR